MEIVLNRRGGVSVRDQLMAQLELRILAGQIGPGERLPSVRALGRRLHLHANTVSAAYRQLLALGHVEMRRGAGIFVRAAGVTSLESAKNLDEMIQVLLDAAGRRGFSTADVRAAAERWLTAPPPSRLLVVDRTRPMAELLAAEVKAVADLPVEACSLAELAAAGTPLEGVFVLSLPYHVPTVRRASPLAAVLPLTLELGSEATNAIRALAKGGIVLVISHAEALLPFADKVVRSLRGDEVLVETRRLGDRSWRRLLPAADLVFADALSAEAVTQVRPRGVRPFRVLGGPSLARVADAVRAAIAAASPKARAPKANATKKLRPRG
jgi:DNA-binding transcriptional regulator YhcF (GntR family)